MSVKTRTYAEINARQGQLPEAIAIYRELLAERPGDPGLGARLAELELQLAGLGSDAALVAPPPPPAPPPRPLPTDLPPRPPARSGRTKKAAPVARAPAARGPAAPKPSASTTPRKAVVAAPPLDAPPVPSGPVDPVLLARARQVERLEKILYRIQNRRRRTS